MSRTLVALSGNVWHMAAILIAIPHSAVDLPNELEPAFLPRVDRHYLLTQSDAFTDQVYSVPEVRSVRYRWSRFVADPNRAEHQASEGGVVPVNDFAMEPIYPKGGEPSLAQRLDRIEKYHRPYHEEVAEAAADPRTRFFVDGHSMAGQAPRRSQDFGRTRPDVVVSNRGGDDGNPAPGKAFLTCSPPLTRWISERLGYWLTHIPAPAGPPLSRIEGSYRINDPFKGGYGVRSHARPQEGRPGIQLELNQRMWCDETSFVPIPGRIDWIREVMSAWARELSDLLLSDELPPRAQAQAQG